MHHDNGSWVLFARFIDVDGHAMFIRCTALCALWKVTVSITLPLNEVSLCHFLAFLGEPVLAPATLLFRQVVICLQPVESNSRGDIANRLDLLIEVERIELK